MSTRRPLRTALRWLLVASVLGLGIVSAWAYPALGTRAQGERRARMERSPQCRDGKFVNPEPIINDFWQCSAS